MDDERLFRTTRTLPHAPQRVYEAFADANQLAAWWGPDGFVNHFERFEFEVGGQWVFVMQGPDGTRYPNHNVFEALEPGRRVVIRHAGEPFFTLSVTLKEAPDGTELLWEQRFDALATARAVAAVVRPSNEQNLDRLAKGLVARTP